MKRYLYLFPLMAITAASLTLGACDDKKTDEQAAEQAAPADTATTDATTPAADTAMEAAPVAPSVMVSAARAYATADAATTGAIFMTVQNPNPQGTTAKLIGAKTDVAAIAEIHESYTDTATGTTEMRKVDSVEIPAGQSVEFSPTSYHVMLTGLTAPLKEGTPFNVTLSFENAADVVVPVVVVPAGDTAAAPSSIPAATDATTAPATDEPMSTTAPATDSSTTTEAPATDEQPVE